MSLLEETKGKIYSWMKRTIKRTFLTFPSAKPDTDFVSMPMH